MTRPSRVYWSDPTTKGRLESLSVRWTEQVAGGVCAIAYGEREVVHPFGQLVVEGRMAPAAAEACFYLTSISKPLVAMQVIALVADGLLDLDAPVAEYVPEFAVSGKEQVTTRQLLSHTSGYDAAANLLEGPPTSLDAAGYLEIAMQAELVQLPGRCFAYCSPPFWVLGELITRVSGTPYVEHFRQRITAPLGDPAVGYYLDSAPPAGTVTPAAEERKRHIVEEARRTAYPAGALMGTAAALLSIGRCILDRGAGSSGRVLSSRAVDLMLTPAAEGTIAGRPVVWGLGWELGGPGSLQSRRGVYHSGASGVAMWVDPEVDLVAVLLTGTFGVPRRVFAEAINGIVGMLT